MASRPFIQLSRATERFLTLPTTTTSRIASIACSPSNQRTSRLSSSSSTKRQQFFPHQTIKRSYSTPSQSQPSSSETTVTAPEYLNPLEQAIFSKINTALTPTKLEVQDISGGCGSMYALDIVSEQFAGLSVMKQHRLVNKILGEEIKGWHGVQLKTKAP